MAKLNLLLPNKDYNQATRGKIMSDEGKLDMVLNQMIKGINKGRIKASPQLIDSFKIRHREMASKILKALPSTCSAGVSAVLAKCLIKYKNEERIFEFCKALKTCVFEGEDDPAHKLWKFLIGKKERNTQATYLKVVEACKNYMEYKKMLSARMAERDFFEWDENLEYKVGKAA